MNAAVKKMWLEALRSGQYIQAKDKLKNGDGFCCLGVLCDLHAKETKKGRWEDGEYCAVGDERIETSDCELPFPVQAWADLPSSTPGVEGIALHTMNDDGVPFADIAARIECDL